MRIALMPTPRMRRTGPGWAQDVDAGGAEEGEAEEGAEEQERVPAFVGEHGVQLIYAEQQREHGAAEGDPATEEDQGDHQRDQDDRGEGALHQRGEPRRGRLGGGRTG